MGKTNTPGAAGDGDATPHDILTGVATRVVALATLRRRLTQAPEDELHCVIVDIDDFGSINAHLGADGADDLLRQVADNIAIILSDSFIGRLGADQFLAITDHPLDEVERGAITAMELPTESGVRILQLSAGASNTTVSGHDADALISDASAALRRAKALGKGRIVEADHQLRQTEMRRRRVARDTRTALENNELVAWAQPIYCLDTDKVAGFELLARWPRADGQFESPGLFIPIVESLGFSYLLGEFMIREAIGLLERLIDAGDLETFVTINVSAIHIAEPLLASLVAVQLERRGVPADRLIIELTESQRLPDTRAGRTAVERLRQIGVGVASDDLGAGWSSLTQMIDSPFTHVKTDRGLIEATAQPGGLELIRAIRMVADGANQISIAEGIEDETELAAVKQAGFALGQGWLLGRPCPIEAALLLLDTLHAPARLG